jgi:DNA mismatch repair ATPase MutS
MPAGQLRTTPADATPQSAADSAANDAANDAAHDAARHPVSLLTPGSRAPAEALTPPDCFQDLALDRVVDAIVAQRVHRAPDAVDGLRRVLYAAPTELDVIRYRQDVMRDLERPAVQASVIMFSDQMRTMRGYLDSATQSSYPLERARWTLAAIALYGSLVRRLADELETHDLRAAGLQATRAYVSAYVARPDFRALCQQADVITRALAGVVYALRIHDQDIVVLPYQEADEYAVQVERLFARFHTGTDHVDRHTTVSDSGRLNHIEAQILDRVAKLHPTPFAAMTAFCAEHRHYLDDQIVQLERELPFYLAYLDVMARLQQAGLPFTYPNLSRTDKTIHVHDAFDLALAWHLVPHGATVVCNDVQMTDPERILVVSGPNHGGKTTFARMVGQLHYLARLGYPVPGRDATLPVCDAILTHFERAETAWYGSGKLQDELLRVHDLLARATPNSLVILNEIFSSTTLRDAVYLATQIVAELSRRDLLAVCVTFLDELARFDAKTVSVVSTVDPRDPTHRTFKLERRPADGLAYAVAIAEQYHVTEAWLRRRLGT